MLAENYHLQLSCLQQNLSSLLNLASLSIAITFSPGISFPHNAHSAVGNALLLVAAILFWLILQRRWVLSLPSFPLSASFLS